MLVLLCDINDCYLCPGMLVFGLGLKANFVGIGLGKVCIALGRLALGINYKTKIM